MTNSSHKHPHTTHAAAVKAAATRKSMGEKPFGHMDSAKRHLAAEKAVATKRARGEKIGGWKH